MADAGVNYVGLHSFMKAPAGLHLTTPDSGTRQKSWDYFARLIDLSADLGDDSVMVLGSSKQRSAVDGSGVRDATARLEEGLARMAPLASERGMTILLEPLSPQFTNVVNTLDQAVGIVRRIASRGLSSMFDTHNTTAETEPHADLIRRHFAYIRHVHLNEMDGRHPGSGNFPFAPVLRALQENGYKGWLSVEVFDFQPDGHTVARNASDFIRRTESALNGKESDRRTSK
jgi:sugar phosphate isomerase/epimerase